LQRLTIDRWRMLSTLLIGATFAMLQAGCAELLTPLPEVPATASDKAIAKTYADNRSAYEELKEMLTKDPTLNNVGEGFINNSKADETPLETALAQAKISKPRYDRYQELLKKAGCKSVGYGVLATDPSKANKEQIWFLIWAISNGPQTHMKTIICTTNGKPPEGYSVIPDTAYGTLASDGSIGVVSEINPNWYIYRFMSGSTKWP